MEYMTTSDAVKKWNISERRVRQLLSEGRIEGAFKIGGNLKMVQIKSIIL